MSSSGKIFSVEKSNNETIAYSCSQLMEDNQASVLKVQYFYDILHPDSVDTADVVAKGEAALLDLVAEHFGLVDGERCSNPPLTALWLIEVTSKATDESVDVFDSCQELKPESGETCKVYKGYMEAHYLGVGDPAEFQSYIQSNLNKVGESQGFIIAYLGQQLDTSLVGAESGKENLDPVVSKVETVALVEDPGKRTFTFVGGLLVAAFLAAFLGLLFVFYRRRQKFLAAQESESALSKGNLDDDTALQDRSGNYLIPEIGDEFLDGHADEFPENNYRFDLGTSMKNELFSIHGRSSDPFKNFGLGIEETSDSDADSWAQTDGTIGSLELPLDPLTAEV